MPPTAVLTTSAIALVLITAMYTELVNNAATGVPTIRLYRPATGFTPASTADAMPSGMAATAATNPATMSRLRVLGFGLRPLKGFACSVMFSQRT